MKFALKQPVRNSQPVGYWLFVTLIIGFLVYLMVINPMLSWDFANDQERYSYLAATVGAFILAGVLMIPVIRNDSAHEHALALIMSNKNYMLHEDTMRLMDKLTYHVWRKGNAKQIEAEVQEIVDKNGGRDMRVQEFGFKPEYAQDLVAINGQ